MLRNFVEADYMFRWYVNNKINLIVEYNYLVKETETDYKLYNELYQDIEYINFEYKKFKSRLRYLKQKEKLKQDKLKLNLLCKSNMLCNDVILYKIAPYMNKKFKQL